MDDSSQVLSQLLEHWLEICTALMVFYFLMRGRALMATYIMISLMAIAFLSSVVTTTDLIAGIIIGVLSNEVFRGIRMVLARERSNSE